jgi:DNA-binding response OmpR family regulator
MARILLVDSDVRYAEFCRGQFAAAGHSAAVSRGSDALERASDFRPEAIVLEIVLPSSRLNGLQLMERILARNKRMLIVVNSAYESYRDHFFVWAADAYITKSWDLTELLSAVHNILEFRRIAHSLENIALLSS